MRDEEILEKIKNDMNETTIPESLEPSNMMNKIKGMSAEEKINRSKNALTEKEEGVVVDFSKINKRKRYAKIGASVAGLAAIAAITFVTLKPSNEATHLYGEETTAMNANAETETHFNSENDGEAAESTTVNNDDLKETTDRTEKEDTSKETTKLEETTEEETTVGVIPEKPTHITVEVKDYDDSGIEKIKSYDELKGMFNEHRDKYFYLYNDAINDSLNSIDDIHSSGNSANTGSSADSNASMKDESNFTDTNERTENVHEEDIIKCDGKYFYIANFSGKKVKIVEANGNDTKKVAEIDISKKLKCDGTISGMYIENNQLIVIVEGSSTTIASFDVSNKNKIKLNAKHEISGYYLTSRLTKGYLYLFTKQSAGYKEMNIPTVDNKKIDSGNIYKCDTETYYSMTIMTSFSMNDFSKVIQKKGVVDDSGYEVYVSGESIYIYGTRYEWSDAENENCFYDSQRYTQVLKFVYGEGKFGAVKKVDITGNIHDSFCIDEYDGYLRIVSTYDEKDTTKNAVYVYDALLNQVGQIKNLAKGERIYSARFMGDVAYFVTYRETDPLFTVDLKDPTNPAIIGKLKIPGFSDYLHPWGDNYLVGIGMIDDENELTLKISLFDISDKTDVKEVDVNVLEGVYYADVQYDYKNCFFDYDNNIFGFNVSYYDEETGECLRKYNLYKIENGKIVEANTFEKLDNQAYVYRGIRVGDIVYVINNRNHIYMYNMKTGKKMKKIKYDDEEYHDSRTNLEYIEDDVFRIAEN